MKKSVKKETGIICCGVLAEELELICQEEEITAEKYYIDPALHVDFDKLRARLIDVLAEVSHKHEDLIIIFGDCYPDIDQTITRYNGNRINAQDCIWALLGDKKEDLDSQGDIFYLTSGYLKHWRDIFASQNGLGWDPIDARQNFGFYDKIILLDTGVREIPEEEILEFFEYTRIPVEPIEIDLTYFKKLVLNRLNHSNRDT